LPQAAAVPARVEDAHHSPYHHRDPLAKRKKAKADATEQLRTLETSWATTASRYATAFQGKKEALRKLRQCHEELAHSYTRDRQQLQTKARDMQLAAFLQQHFISDASIRGIATTRKATLASFGIETAFDIEAEAVMQVPGFKAKLTHRLVRWRQEVEAKFVFDPTAGVPLPERQALEVRYATARQTVEAQLLAGEGELLDIRRRADGELRTLTQNIKSCLQLLTQAQVDLTVFSPGI
jgi:DNA-binding helix-hairpin-helix protein with protein kinase domain